MSVARARRSVLRDAALGNRGAVATLRRRPSLPLNADKSAPPAWARRRIALPANRRDREQIEPVTHPRDLNPATEPLVGAAIEVEPPAPTAIDGDDEPGTLA